MTFSWILSIWIIFIGDLFSKLCLNKFLNFNNSMSQLVCHYNCQFMLFYIILILLLFKNILIIILAGFNMQPGVRSHVSYNNLHSNCITDIGKTIVLSKFRSVFYHILVKISFDLDNYKMVNLLLVFSTT